MNVIMNSYAILGHFGACVVKYTIENRYHISQENSHLVTENTLLVITAMRAWKILILSVSYTLCGEGVLVLSYKNEDYNLTNSLQGTFIFISFFLFGFSVDIFTFLHSFFFNSLRKKLRDAFNLTVGACTAILCNEG